MKLRALELLSNLIKLLILIKIIVSFQTLEMLNWLFGIRFTDTVWGAVACSSRVVDTMEKLLGFEVYHYHSKISIKHPGSGGKWRWHQDYGYWYDYGCLFPDLGSVMIALDTNTKENGCLKFFAVLINLAGLTINH